MEWKQALGPEKQALFWLANCVGPGLVTHSLSIASYFESVSGVLHVVINMLQKQKTNLKQSF